MHLKLWLQRTLSNPKVNVIYNAIVKDIFGSKDEGVDSIEINDVINGSRKIIKCDGVFMAIGHIPNTQLFKDLY